MASSAPTGGGVVGVEMVASMRGYLQSLQEAGKLSKAEAAAMAKDYQAMARSVSAAQKTIIKGQQDIAAKSKIGAQAADEWAATFTRAGSVAQRSGSHMGNFARQIGDVGTMAAMGQSPMMILTSQSEQLFFALREAGGVSAIMSTTVGALAGVVAGAALQFGVLYLAVRGYGEEQREVAAAQAMTARGLELLAPIIEHTKDVTIDLRVATGDLTKVQGEQYRASQAALERFNSTTEETRKKLGEVNAAHSSFTTQMVNRMEAVVPAWTPLGAVIDTLTTSSFEYEQQQGALQRVLDHGIGLTRESVKIEHEAIEAKDEAANASKRHKEALSAEARALRILKAAQGDLSGDAAKRANDYNTAIDKLHDLTAASNMAAASELDRIDIAEKAAKMSAGSALVDASFLGSTESRIEAQRSFQDAITAIEAEAEQKRLDYHDKMAKKREKVDKKALDTQKRLTQQALQVVGQVADTIVGGIGAAYDVSLDNLASMQAYQSQVEEYLTETQKDQLDERVKDQKDATRRSFETYKAAQIAQAVIGTASAFVSALDDAPYPANLILAGLSAAAGGTQIAAIASQQPSFHKGGGIDMAPDELSIKAQRGEYMMSRQGRAAAGEATLARYNAGMSESSSPSVVLVNAYRHSAEVDRYEGDRLNRNGPYSRAIRGKALPGVRS